MGFDFEKADETTALLKLIEPHYPVAGRGRRPYPLDSIWRVHLLQNWFALSARPWRMHQAKRGRAMVFGMKAHIGVDADSGLVHKVTTTADNESDLSRWQTCCMGGKNTSGATPVIG